ncbi:MAG: MoxR family ATPase [Lachnospira sp.]|nr:MoxR family ATPase [Lachnospira sp.]
MQNIEQYCKQIADVKKQVQKVVFGKDEVIDKIMMAIIGSGHVLIDDIPGVGKTTMANAFSRAMGLSQKLLHFTPDVLPSDITGFSMYDKESGTFQYHPGAVMYNLFLADEINRTSPKTQSALLEVMEEGRLTVDGETRTVPQPFVVLATQNPAGSIGTQKLPESQLDRFMIRTSMGYPSMEAEARIIMGKKNNLMDTVNQVLSIEELVEIRGQVKQVYMEESVCLYIAQLSNASRNHESVSLGISPRGSVAISGMAKACAFMNGRDYVTPDDVKTVLPETMIHRLVLNARVKVNKVTEADVITDIMQSVKVPELKIRR